jgi:hypothetical protein
MAAAWAEELVVVMAQTMAGMLAEMMARTMAVE